jgi:hypothetical protein
MLSAEEKENYIRHLRAELATYSAIIEDTSLTREERIKAAERRNIAQAVGINCYKDGNPMKLIIDRFWAEGYTIPWRSGKAWYIRKADNADPRLCSAYRLHDRREWDYVRMLAEGA